MYVILKQENFSHLTLDFKTLKSMFRTINYILLMNMKRLVLPLRNVLYFAVSRFRAFVVFKLFFERPNHRTTDRSRRFHFVEMAPENEKVRSKVPGVKF